MSLMAPVNPRGRRKARRRVSRTILKKTGQRRDVCLHTGRTGQHQIQPYRNVANESSTGISKQQTNVCPCCRAQRKRGLQLLVNILRTNTTFRARPACPGTEECRAPPPAGGEMVSTINRNNHSSTQLSNIMFTTGRE